MNIVQSIKTLIDAALIPISRRIALLEARATLTQADWDVLNKAAALVDGLSTLPEAVQNAEAAITAAAAEPAPVADSGASSATPSGSVTGPGIDL
jgi:hypothetical protein